MLYYTASNINCLILNNSVFILAHASNCSYLWANIIITPEYVAATTR